jgi:hypothetical protein
LWPARPPGTSTNIGFQDERCIVISSDSEFDRQQYANALTKLRGDAELPVEALANLIGVSPDLVLAWEAAEQLPTVEQNDQLARALNWPLTLPPRKVVEVTFGGWSKPYDEQLAPFAREMLIAGFPMTCCDVGPLGVAMIWPRSQRTAAFLNIVAPFEDGADTLYTRANPTAESEGRIPKWSFELTLEDINGGDGDGPRMGETAHFTVGLYMRFPPHDLATVTERLRAQNRAGRVRSGEAEPAERIVRLKTFPEMNLGGETLWAVPIGPETAFIQNIPFCSNEVAWHDIVRLSPSGDVLEILERVTRSVRATYEAAKEKDDLAKEWTMIRAHFRRHDIECESGVRGLFALAVPTTVSDGQLLDLYAKCPVKLHKLRLPGADSGEKK